MRLLVCLVAVLIMLIPSVTYTEDIAPFEVKADVNATTSAAPAMAPVEESKEASKPVTEAASVVQTEPTPSEPAKDKPTVETTTVTVNETKPSSLAAQRPDPKTTKVSMSFDKADINSVIKFLSTASGTPIVCDASLSGSVSIVSLKQVCLNDAYEVVNSALRVRGFTMIGDLLSNVIRVTPLKKATADRSEVQSGKDPSAIVPTDNMLTQVIPLEYVSALKLKDDLKEMVSSDQAGIVAISAANTLIVTDNSGNVRRIAEVIQALDKDTSDVIEVKVHRCQHASADNLEDSLTKIFQIKPATPTPQPNQPRQEGGQPPQVKVDDGLVSLKGEIRIASDARTNQLIISTSKEKMKLVMDVVNQLDVDTEPEVKAETFQLQYADAKMVADQLNKLFEQPQGNVGGTTRYPFYYGQGGQQQSKTTDYAGLKRNVVVADIRTNSVIVTATEQNMKAFKEMIEKLDAPKVLSEVTRIFPLKYAKAAELADTLNSLFRGNFRRQGGFFDFFFGGYNQNQEGGPIAELRNITVVAEDKTNTLLVTGPPQSFTMIEQMIDKLDKRTAQVFIEVAIVDVTLDKETQFGIEWNWTSAAKNPDGTPKETANTDYGLSKLTTGFKYSVISDSLKSLLRMLETRSNVKVYSTPTITTADNIEAQISIGSEVPFVTSEIEDVSGRFRRTVDFKQVAVALRVTPHVNEASDVIAMDLRQTINEVIGRETELDAPTIASREVKTSISVKDGQTVVIGGIMKQNKELIIKRIPILSRIPLIGQLFTSRDWSNTKSELMVFLTPHVLKDDDDVTKVTDEAKGKLSYPPPGLEPSGERK